jgi:hypothetical protein
MNPMVAIQSSLMRRRIEMGVHVPGFEKAGSIHYGAHAANLCTTFS